VRETDSDWIIFLNNDVIVPPGWLKGLRNFAAKLQLDIVSPAIREGEYNYNINDYAELFTREMGDIRRFGVADGICFMVRREVFETIGLFDENFRIGQFEDTDFFRRARIAEMRLAITGSSILHHFGSVTQDSIRKKRTARPYESENRAYYRRKWKLTWWRRLLERRWIKIRGHWWCATELLSHGYTLKMKWEHGRLRHY
jgi:GT2 family glycosyltransferase